MPEELPLPCEYVLREHCSGAPRRILGRAEGRDSHGNSWRAVWLSPSPQANVQGQAAAMPCAANADADAHADADADGC